MDAEVNSAPWRASAAVVWRRFLDDVLDVLFPWCCPVCGGEALPAQGFCGRCRGAIGTEPSWRCPRCGRPRSETACSCRGELAALDGVVAAAEYLGEARLAVHRLKYRGDSRCGRAMGTLLASGCKKLLDLPIDLVVPVPLGKLRQRQRGFNQSSLIARVVGRELGKPVGYDFLERPRETPVQAGLTVDARRGNVSGAFALRSRRNPAGLSVVLVDDVYTTGATLSACAEVLKNAGAVLVVGAVFACSSRLDG